MGQLLSIAGRKMNRFNVENRAHRILEKYKPTPAPKYESNIKDFQRVAEADPQFLEKQYKKDSILDGRLKQVFVTSTDRTIPRTPFTPDDPTDRKLPLDRQTPEDFEYGFQEPQRLTRGKVTLRQAMQFIGDHQLEPKEWTIEKIASEYKMKEALVTDILENFKAFQVHIPNVSKKGTLLTQSDAKKKLIGQE